MITHWQKTILSTLMVLALGIPATFAHEETEKGTVVQGELGVREVAPLPGHLERNRIRGLFLHPGLPADIARQTRPSSPYYIGVALHPVTDQLRAHVDLPDGVGLIVTHVFEESPATEADLKRHDILLRADGHDLKRREDLMQVVNEHSGENNWTQFTLDIVRRGQRQTLWVTPEFRPLPPKVERPGIRESRSLIPREHQHLLEQLRNRVEPSSAKEIQIQPRRFPLNQFPADLSISMQKENDGPTHITVKRGDETWEIEGDDAEALAELPDDLRPFVEKMLDRQKDDMRIEGFSPSMRERIEIMEREMQELREQLEEQRQEK